MDTQALRSPRDRYRVNINDENEVRYWTYALGVSRETLRAAVEEVGVKVNDVRSFLGQRVTSS
jgi:hypothetical protein